MTLIYSTSSSDGWSEHSEVAQKLIKDGIGEVMDSLGNESLLNRAVLLPMEIVSLLSLQLLQDSTGSYPNLGATYSEYLDALVSCGDIGGYKLLAVY
jgi:hypothetical protein